MVKLNMPFKKLKSGKYRGPSGKIFTAKQVKLYYSLGGKFPGHKIKKIKK